MHTFSYKVVKYSIMLKFNFNGSKRWWYFSACIHSLHFQMKSYLKYLGSFSAKLYIFLVVLRTNEELMKS